MPVPTTAPRECILVDGHRYCQDEPFDPHSFGVLLILTTVATAYVAFAVYRCVESDRPGVTALTLVAAPLLFIGAWLALH